MTTLIEFSEGMDLNKIITGCLLLALAVVAGAFGAHALQGLLDAKYQHTYQTAVTYHFYHAFALIICGMLSPSANIKRLQWAILFFKFGLLLFCGSLYALCMLTAKGFITFKWLGMITPLGGLCFIIGWILLAYALTKART
jgi:uncharacterized membrane protein YgdD (TMEM256/DUF423 family)